MWGKQKGSVRLCFYSTSTCSRPVVFRRSSAIFNIFGLSQMERNVFKRFCQIFTSFDVKDIAQKIQLSKADFLDGMFLKRHISKKD
jgi:hypothetical protein